jgi:beta-fructofuranosidase
MRSLGKPQEVVLRATSTDLQSWTKDHAFSLPAPLDLGYEPDDWRDPFVFWNDDAREWWMVITARKSTGPSRNRGLLACAASPDLRTWTVRDPFWAPDLYLTHECPDLFRIGDWWYLLWSEYSDRMSTRYRRSRSLDGPWLAAPDDAFDTGAFYAAKTAGDGTRRYLFGWLATREGESDFGEWQWGGNLVVHELVQNTDGTLAVRAPARIGGEFPRLLELRPRPVLGGSESNGDTVVIDAEERAAATLLAEMPERCKIEATVRFFDPAMTCGVLLRASDTLDSYYQVRLEPARQRIVFDRCPRPGGQPFMLERPVQLQPDTPVRIRCFVDDSAVVVYVDETTALSCRMYDHSVGSAGLFAVEGRAVFTGVALSGP